MKKRRKTRNDVLDQIIDLLLEYLAEWDHEDIYRRVWDFIVDIETDAGSLTIPRDWTK